MRVPELKLDLMLKCAVSPCLKFFMHSGAVTIYFTVPLVLTDIEVSFITKSS